MVPGDNSERGLPTMPMMTLSGDSATPTVTPLAMLERADAGYPGRLLALGSPPAVLWYRGRLPDAAAPSLAVVGSRGASGSGCRMARSWSQALAGEGWTVVSGGAFGIDAAAH